VSLTTIVRLGAAGAKDARIASRRTVRAPLVVVLMRALQPTKRRSFNTPANGFTDEEGGPMRQTRIGPLLASASAPRSLVSGLTGMPNSAGITCSPTRVLSEGRRPTLAAL
jgi:hypothetical protein